MYDVKLLSQQVFNYVYVCMYVCMYVHMYMTLSLCMYVCLLIVYILTGFLFALVALDEDAVIDKQFTRSS